MDKEKLKQQLIAIFGAERVKDDSAVLEEFSGDMTEIETVMPAFVVEADGTEQIEELLKLANRVKLPVTPRVAGTNLGGLSIPSPGGVVLDLRRMNRILEVDEDEMYCVIEPGVTYAQIRAYLDQHHPSLRIGYPLAPPEVSVVCNCLCAGLGNLSLKHGSMDEWLNGLEVVLPSGDLLRTGSMAIGSSPCARVPLPDLTGLFVSFQGTTGVVTKAAIELYPNPPERFRGFILNYSLEGSFEVLRQLSRLEICDDLGGLSWPTGKMLFGIERPGEKDPDEPEFFLYLDVSAHDSIELEYKMAQVDKVVAAARKKDFKVEAPLSIQTLVKLNPKFGQFAEFPTRLDFLLDHEGGGLTWVGLYGPASKYEVAARAGEKIMARHGFPPTMVSRPMKGGHFAVLRFIEIFNKKDPEEVERIRACNLELAQMALEHGFVQYKTPAWAIEKVVAPNVDPGFLKLTQQIKKLLDPNGIMNPGKWQA